MLRFWGLTHISSTLDLSEGNVCGTSRAWLLVSRNRVMSWVDSHGKTLYSCMCCRTIVQEHHYVPQLTWVEGGCFCGACRFRLPSLPTDVQFCYCRRCRLYSGSFCVPWVQVNTINGMQWTRKVGRRGRGGGGGEDEEGGRFWRRVSENHTYCSGEQEIQGWGGVGGASTTVWSFFRSLGCSFVTLPRVLPRIPLPAPAALLKAHLKQWPGTYCSYI